MRVTRGLVVLAVLAVARAALLPLDAERLHASVGGYAVMNCHLDFPFGNEIPYHLQWDKDGEAILSWYSGEVGAAPRLADRWGGRVRRVGDGRALGRGSINVTAVRETDAGLYRCRVTFPNRSPPARNNGTFYYLEVDGGNLIVTPPVNVTVLEGARAELECAPKSSEAVVQWYKEDVPLSQLPELSARAELPANGSLVVRSAASADIGQYECRVSEPDGARQSAAAFLDVHYEAKVVYSPEERYLPYGKPASLDCHFSANPPLTNLRWEKDGFLFDPYNVPGVFYSRNGSLLFNKVDESHEGRYSCTPYNALGTAGASRAVRVRVQQPPQLAARPAPLYLARLGAALTMPCAPTAPADPTDAPPDVLWARKDGRPLPEGRHAVSGGNLTLTDIDAEDRGEYECTVSNAAAALRASTELLVENAPPRAPHRLAAAPAARSLRLSWLPGDSSDEVEYTVWYRERAATEWRTMRLLSRGTTEATLAGLRPVTEYELRVLAQDQIGDGLFSKPLFVTTLESEVSGEGETAYAVAVTESDVEEMTEGSGSVGSEGEELQVSVRLVDEGALVRWAAGGARCSVRWYGGAAGPAALLAASQTHHDYLLVSSVEEGWQYRARVWCAGGARGAGEVHVPRYSRLRAAAGAAAAAALLLAALLAAVLAARRRLRPAADKRRR